MDFFSRNRPVYKNATGRMAYAQTASSSGLSGLLGSLLGNATPSYKTVDGQSVKVSTPGVWSMFIAAPSYKTAPAMAVASGDIDAELESSSDACDGVEESGVRVLEPDQIVVL